MDIELYAIQKALKARGFDPGTLDGVWGKDTRRAMASLLGIKTVKQPASDAMDAPWYDLAVAEIGTKEVPGASSNAVVVDYFRQAVAAAQPDSVPWCAAFVGAMLVKAGYKPSGSLMARSYLDWGTQLAKPRKGCIVVFKRGAAPAGHVGFVENWTAGLVRCVGGNQSDAVTAMNFARAGVLGFRWPSEAA